jgi:hypothetical protein
VSLTSGNCCPELGAASAGVRRLAVRAAPIVTQFVTHRTAPTIDRMPEALQLPRRRRRRGGQRSVSEQLGKAAEAIECLA